MKKKTMFWLIFALLAACANGTAQPGPQALAQLQPTKGSTASGTATFTQRGDKVLVEAKLPGLTPNAEHGFHVHDKGDCSSGDGLSAGPHFNPFGKQHAQFTTPERHAGDLPALKADASGNATVSFELDVITVADGPASVIGRGLIVHAHPDDYTTQPTGNSGARIACAVIQRG